MLGCEEGIKGDVGKCWGRSGKVCWGVKEVRGDVRIGVRGACSK